MRYDEARTILTRQLEKAEWDRYPMPPIEGEIQEAIDAIFEVFIFSNMGISADSTKEHIELSHLSEKVYEYISRRVASELETAKAKAPVTCADCNTPLTSSDQYAMRDGEHICAPGYGCRESEKRHSELDEDEVKV